MIPATSTALSRWSARIACGCLFLIAADVTAVDFVPLGHLPGRFLESEAFGISGDGQVVVGQSGGEAFRWTGNEGMIGLGDFPGGPFESRANAASFDGSVIVGEGHVECEDGFCTVGDGVGVAFQWIDEEGMVTFSHAQIRSSTAVDVSADGTVLIESNDTRHLGALLWKQEQGLVFLPYPDGLWDTVNPTAISADASVVVGDMFLTVSTTPFRWTNGVGADILFSSNLNFFMRDTSADGSVIVGSNENSEAFRWTESDGPITMPPPGGMNLSSARAISADGTVIAGYIGQEHSEMFWFDAAVWDEDRDWRRIDEILTRGGIDLTGWDLRWANDISADGRVVVGRGINPDGNTEAWMAVIPEPATLLMSVPLFAVGICVIRKAGRDRR
jgi:probable HAF family extracellular repeat protein